MQLALSGLDIDNEKEFQSVVKTLSGSVDGLREPNTLLLFEKQATKLDVKVGDNVIVSVLTPRGVNNTLDLRVVGIAQDLGFMSSWTAFLPNSAIRQLKQALASRGLLVTASPSLNIFPPTR